jgi:hypothetical protein
MSCFEMDLIASFFISGFAERFSSSLPFFVVWKEIFYVFLEEGVFVLGKLNFESN